MATDSHDSALHSSAANCYKNTESKNYLKSVRVIIYTVVKINSRSIGIGGRSRKVSSSTHTGGGMHPRANLLIQRTKIRTSPPQHKPGPVYQNHENPLHPIRTKTAGCGSVTISTLQNGVGQPADTTNSWKNERIARM